MASSNLSAVENSETAASAVDLTTYADDTIYMLVDGYVGLLPRQNFDHMDSAENDAYWEGRKQQALRSAQPVVKKAIADGEDPRQVLNEFLATFKPKATSFQTLGEKRTDVTRDLFAERLDAAGRGDTAAQIRNGAPIANETMNGFAAKYADEIASRLSAWANTYHAPRKRGTGSATGPISADLDSL